MRVETGLTLELKDVPAEAQRIEALGYDGVIVPETTHDPFFPLLVGAEHTTRLGFGTAVAIAFPRSPMMVANIAWDLAGYSGGRFRLGLGTQVKGHNQRRFSTPWSPPAPRMREYVQALKAIWNTWATGARLDFQGQHYTFTLMTPNFTPPPIDHPNIPVYISAVGPIMCQVAGEVCDGLRMHSFNTPRYMEDVVLPNLEKGAKKAGRSLKEIDLVCTSFSAVGSSDEEIAKARRQVASNIAFYGSTRTYQGVFDVHGWGDLTGQLHEMSLKGEWAKMGTLITDQVLEEFAVIGTPEDVAGQLLKKYGPYCQTATFSPPAGTDPARVKAAVKQLQAG